MSANPAARHRALVTTVPIVLLIVALAAFVVDRGLAWRQVVKDSHDGTAAVAAASQEVTALTTVSSTTSDADIARLLDGATAGFRDQFKKQADAFAKALRSGKVTSTGTIASAGLVSLEGDRATVVVAATGTVKNKQTPTAQPRDYRLRAEMQRVDGTWLVSGLEFVA